MGYGDTRDQRWINDQKKVAAIINEYVRENGFDVIKKTSELNDMVKDISFESKFFQHSDICYNKVNEGTLKYFEEDVHVYEKTGHGYYRLLGENYPYTGEIIHAGNGQILGEWVNGKLVEWQSKEREAEGQYKATASQEFTRIALDTESIKGEDRLVITKQRVNQSVFRRRLVKRFASRCALCGVIGEEMLIASHIKPWSEAEMEERIDVNNGLLLCPNHDFLFDKGYISFNEEGRIIFSKKLNEVNQLYMNVNDSKVINISKETQFYMEYHRNNVFLL